MEQTDALRAAVRDVADFPKPGILFKDIARFLATAACCALPLNVLWLIAQGRKSGKSSASTLRGFLFGATVADRLGIGFVPIRKRGKLPWKTESLAYKLEYGEAAMEVHTDAFEPGERVSLIDDLLATGGTAAAAAKLIAKAGGNVVQAQFLIELGFLDGRTAFSPIPAKSILVY